MNSAHPDYVAAAAGWSRARDVLAGEDAVKAAGDKYLPKLDSQREEEHEADKARASFFGGTAQAVEEYLDLVFRPGFFLNKNTFPLRSLPTHTALELPHEKKNT